MEKVELFIQYLSNYDLDKWGEMGYAHEGDACFDLRAAISEPIRIFYNQIKIIPNGFKTAFDSYYVLHMYPRSGLATKGITLINAVGTIDSGYRGEVKTCLINHNERPQTINPGDRIAQAKLQIVPKVLLTTVQDLNSTARGESGFGDSGLT